MRDVVWPSVLCAVSIAAAAGLAAVDDWRALVAAVVATAFALMALRSP